MTGQGVDVVKKMQKQRVEGGVLQSKVGGAILWSGWDTAVLTAQ